jgi:hypothetical protein
MFDRAGNLVAPGTIKTDQVRLGGEAGQLLISES